MMAQLAKGEIKVGISLVVGRIQVDRGSIRGEAGPAEPRGNAAVRMSSRNAVDKRRLAKALDRSMAQNR